ncbi:hypothetical protein COX59_03645 [Candidatus Beckwithbacteria bacterium CG_4_10_14_0_2_um_filter_47_25]|uniref:Uncharacterized protein n=1 Tax=Candidatus Beckwithbacteria bacterium CG_4_10_14_0_2_um_filter_47_25 TaxID=1974493 RepID=A0A2M7W6I8_9BACT|nr:MAG: hypothetical protein COX59_03645 [Candidatus Beckwithbacteria bacterium CG_4_10_14_0_2_um_filter_47_25]
MCELYKGAKELAAKRGLVLPDRCHIEIDCNGLNCSVAHLGEDVGGDGLVQQYEGQVNRCKFEARVEKSVTIMQAQH